MHTPSRFSEMAKDITKFYEERLGKLPKISKTEENRLTKLMFKKLAEESKEEWEDELKYRKSIKNK